jgi:hypothetical protein
MCKTSQKNNFLQTSIICKIQNNAPCVLLLVTGNPPTFHQDIKVSTPTHNHRILWKRQRHSLDRCSWHLNCSTRSKTFYVSGQMDRHILHLLHNGHAWGHIRHTQYDEYWNPLKLLENTLWVCFIPNTIWSLKW